MQARNYQPEDIDPAFGNWLAGFIDGEGCFIIRPPVRAHARYRWICVFTLVVRDDDRPVIEEIIDRVGIGNLVTRNPGKGASSQVGWQVMNKADCASLVVLLRRFPLRAKKARDFAVWAEAVGWWTRQQRKGHGHPRDQAHYDWSIMEQLHGELVAGRAYQAETPSEPSRRSVVDSGLIRLFVD